MEFNLQFSWLHYSVTRKEKQIASIWSRVGLSEPLGRPVGTSESISRCNTKICALLITQNICPHFWYEYGLSPSAAKFSLFNRYFFLLCIMDLMVGWNSHWHWPVVPGSCSLQQQITWHCKMSTVKWLHEVCIPFNLPLCYIYYLFVIPFLHMILQCLPSARHVSRNQSLSVIQHCQATIFHNLPGGFQKLDDEYFRSLPQKVKRQLTQKPATGAARQHSIGLSSGQKQSLLSLVYVVTYH